jgi:hypothetical protein
VSGGLLTLFDCCLEIWAADLILKTFVNGVLLAMFWRKKCVDHCLSFFPADSFWMLLFLLCF